MSSLLENILNKNNKLVFNFSKSLNENIYQNKYDIEMSLPIEPASNLSGWQEYHENKKNFIGKTYYFDYYKHMIYFINEILSYADLKNHYPELSIKESHVFVSLSTKEINEVTEIDIEYSKYIDEIFDEIKYIEGI